MAKRFDLTGENVTRRESQRNTYGNQTPLSSTAVERGETHWMDGSYVRIDGLLDVNGTAEFTGLFTASGTNELSGTNYLSGTNHLTGPTDVAGNFEIIAGGLFKSGTVEIRPDGSADFGTLNIESDGTLNVNNDVNVMEDGIINVGTNMKLTPSDDGGAMVFQDGSKVSSVGGTVQVKSSSTGVGFTAGLNTAGIGAGPNGAIMSVGDDGEWVIQGGQATIQSVGSRISATGELSVSDQLSVGNMSTAPSGTVANVYWDSSSKRLMVVL